MIRTDVEMDVKWLIDGCDTPNLDVTRWMSSMNANMTKYFKYMKAIHTRQHMESQDICRGIETVPRAIWM